VHKEQKMGLNDIAKIAKENLAELTWFSSPNAIEIN